MMPKRLRSLIGNTRASVALETALVMPVVILIGFGCWETYTYVRAASIVDRVATTVADLIARKSTLYDDTDASDSDNIGAYYEAAELIAEPLDLSQNATLIISAVYNDGDSSKITWQRTATFSTTDSTSRIGSEGSTVTLVNEEDTDIDLREDETVIVAELFYDYDPFAITSAVWSDAPTNITLYRRAIYMSRYGGINELQ